MDWWVLLCNSRPRKIPTPGKSLPGRDVDLDHGQDYVVETIRVEVFYILRFETYRAGVRIALLGVE